MHTSRRVCQTNGAERKLCGQRKFPLSDFHSRPTRDVLQRQYSLVCAFELVACAELFLALYLT